MINFCDKIKTGDRLFFSNKTVGIVVKNVRRNNYDVDGMLDMVLIFDVNCNYIDGFPIEELVKKLNDKELLSISNSPTMVCQMFNVNSWGVELWNIEQGWVNMESLEEE